MASIALEVTLPATQPTDALRTLPSPPLGTPARRASSPTVTSQPPLTPARIAALKPGQEMSDASSGLRVRVTQNAARSFRLSVRTPEGRLRWITLGHWSLTPKPRHLTLSQARDWVDKLKEARRTSPEQLAAAEAELRALIDPTTGPAVEGGVLTVKAVADDFLTYIERRRKRPEHARRPIEFDVIPAIGKRPISAVTTLELREIVEGVAQGTSGTGDKGPRTRPAPRQAGVVHAILKQFFDFAYKRGDIDKNPMERLDDAEVLGAQQNVCQRFLSPTEIGELWRALDDYRGLTPTVRNGLRLLLLTGVRTGELLKARLEDVDLEKATWTVPVANQKLTREKEKTARPWIVPLAPMALALVKELHGLAKTLRSPFLMASFHGGDDGAALTEKSLNHAMRRLFVGAQPLLKFEGDRPTPHDLRRTVRTYLGELGTPWHVAERCLNHSLGKIANTYDVGDYLTERRSALANWESYLSSLLPTR
jgi:integrase